MREHMPEGGVRIRITSEESLITELAEELRRSDLPILSSGVVESPGRLALDFDTVASIVTVVTGLSGPIGPALLGRLRKHKKTRVIVDGPEKRVEIEWHKAITAEEVNRALKIVSTL
jgi:hypothetical protein